MYNSFEIDERILNMKHTKLAVLFLAPLFLLTGCDSVLSNFDQQVDFAKFKEKVQEISHHEYASASATGYTNLVDDLKEEYTWDGYNWVSDSANKTSLAKTYISTSAGDIVKIIDTSTSASDISKKYKFKTGISGNYLITYSDKVDGGEENTEMKFNKYGYMTHYYHKVNYTGSLLSLNSTIELNISYK